jgi:hypothetical protein
MEFEAHDLTNSCLQPVARDLQTLTPKHKIRPSAICSTEDGNWKLSLDFTQRPRGLMASKLAEMSENVPNLYTL